MSFYQGRASLPRRFRLVLSSVLQAAGLPFSDVLTEQDIEDAFDDEQAWFAQEEDDVYTPPLTLWAFLSQVLHKQEQRSCLAAVSRVAVLIVIQRLATRIADGCEKEVRERWLWKGRHVKLADGTTVSMPDTEANQNAYPQQASQAEGIGFPIARMVVLLSLATAMVCGMAMGPLAASVKFYQCHANHGCQLGHSSHAGSSDDCLAHRNCDRRLNEPTRRQPSGPNRTTNDYFSIVLHRRPTRA